jgi:TRAP-type mannitol/chloroaromatic compound transport system permease small subunit
MSKGISINDRNYLSTVIYRSIAAAMVAYFIFFLINNYLIFIQGWPGPINFIKHQQWFGFLPLRKPLTEDIVNLGWIQFIGLLAIPLLSFMWSYITPQRKLRDDAKLWSGFSTYIIRTAFWGVFFIGIVDATISFLRVEDLLILTVGDELATQLGRSVFRGTYVLYPLFIVGAIIAYRSKNIDFIWLALLVVVAEFTIVITRFIFSYEQAFQGDLVRFWYAALFLFASSYALVTEGHVRVDVLYASFSKKAKSITNMVGCIVLGMPLCWTILLTGMWTRGSSLNGPIISFETYQQGYGMYVKYIMVGFMIIFALSMMVQFVGYALDNLANLYREEGETYETKSAVEEHSSAEELDTPIMQ